MKFTIEQLAGQCLILTGNGRGEVYLLRVISRKLNGSSTLLSFPHFPSKISIEIPEPQTTLAVLKSLITYVEKFDLGLFLIVIDLEHFKVGIISDIEEKLTSIGVSMDRIEMLNPPQEDALRVKGRLKGGRDFILLISVMGITECPKIEYHVARVIEHKYGVRMEICPSKEDIREVLKQRGVRNYGKLVDDLDIGDIERDFPQLIQVLRAVEEIIEP